MNFPPEALDLFTDEEKAEIEEGGRKGISRDAAKALLLERAKEERLDLSPAQARHVADFLRGKPGVSIPRRRRSSLEDAAVADLPGERRTYTEKGNEATVTLVTARVIKTLDDLLEACEMDGEVWEVLDWEASAWNAPVKDAEQDVSIVQLHRVKARFKRKVYEPCLRELAASLLTDLAAGAPSLLEPAKPSGEHLTVIHTPDLHLGKIPLEDDYDAEAIHNAAVNDLIQKAEAFGTAQFVFPVGNDALNTDGSRRSTTAGTMQDGLGRWQEEFRVLVRLYRRAIDKMMRVAPVHVVVVPGNHDEDAVFYLGEVLSEVYSSADSVTIDAGLDPRKYYQYEGVLLGFTHGKDSKLKDLPLLMATEAPELWSRATAAREWLTGHLHMKQVESPAGVTVRISPSLSPTDDWHKRKGYVGQPRAAEAIIFHPSEGRVGEFVFNVPKV